MGSVPELDRRTRARLAEKGRILLEKSCGAGGEASCAEGFVRHHLGLGRDEVAEDFAAFLDDRVAAFRRHDPDGRLAATEALLARVRALLRAGRSTREDSGGTPGAHA